MNQKCPRCGTTTKQGLIYDKVNKNLLCVKCAKKQNPNLKVHPRR